ncbi:MAG: ASKHA domain-containing protein [Acidimicrobiia bacterium]|nr:ASKHA domain-containing protein [Acidimicrobiia bacterium]
MPESTANEAHRPPTSTDQEADHRIVFTPSGLSGAVPPGTTVLDAARLLGVDLDSVCGGRGICGRCQVTPGFGEFPKWSISSSASSLSDRSSVEDAYRGRRPLAAADRLGCAAHVHGDLIVDVPATSQLHRQVVRKEVALGALELDPLITLHYLELAETTCRDGPPLGPASEPEDASPAMTEVLRRALVDQWQIEPAGIDPSALTRLQGAVTAGRCTVGVRGGHVVAIWPGFVDRVLGVAIDIGSTTVAGHLCDLTDGEIVASAGRMNPQIRYGEDLMSRVSYAMLNEGGAAAMTGAIRAALGELIGDLLTEAASTDETVAADRIVDVVAVGNPIMHHLVLGLDPTPLGQAPFPLTTDQPVDTTTAALAIDSPTAAVHVGPCIAGHVGADTVAAILAEELHRHDAVQLLVDVGTNAEIVLGNRRHLLAASSPTGPAFEGAQISSGQRATIGAIERVRIDRDTLEPRYRVIGSDDWYDATDTATGERPATGICGSGIIEAISELFLAGAIDAQGVIVPGGAARSGRVEQDDRTFAYRLTETIRITQADVRAVQLAKAALRAGIDLLLERAEWDVIDEIRLAGAFGAHIDPIHAMVLGLLPDCAPDRVRSVGNAAGAGAIRALLSGRRRAELVDIARSVTKIETATEPRFQELFVAALAFPHASAATPRLASVIDLPTPAEPVAAGRSRRRRRRAGTATTPKTIPDEETR